MKIMAVFYYLYHLLPELTNRNLQSIVSVHDCPCVYMCICRGQCFLLANVNLNTLVVEWSVASWRISYAQYPSWVLESVEELARSEMRWMVSWGVTHGGQSLDKGVVKLLR